MAQEFDAHYAARQLARRASPLRRWVKAAYLSSTLREIDGATLDFGCGAGQLLERLPEGSTGLEVNPVLVDDLRSRGMDVRLYDASSDNFSFFGLEAGRYRTFVASHVLEHFADAATVLRRIAAGCERLGVDRLVVVLPGWKGFLSDDTHRTFVDAAYVAKNGLLTLGSFRLAHRRSFPVDQEWAGRLFIYSETLFVWRR